MSSRRATSIGRGAMSVGLTCSCGKRRRTSDESPETHGPECCTCPPGTIAHIPGCIASYQPALEEQSMLITIFFTHEFADRSGVASSERMYVGKNVQLIPCLEDLITISGASSADVVRVEVA